MSYQQCQGNKIIFQNLTTSLILIPTCPEIYLENKIVSNIEQADVPSNG